METPDTFDWVTARSKCCLKGQFLVLGEALESDVAKINAVGRRGVRFELVRHSDDRLVVVRTRDLGGIQESETVTFTLSPGSIVVTTRDANGPRTLFSGSPKLNVGGSCFLTVNGEALYLWQFTRKALEDLFFNF